MMSAPMLFPPHDPENDFAVLFYRDSGLPSACAVTARLGNHHHCNRRGLVPFQNSRIPKMEAPARFGTDTNINRKGKRSNPIKLTPCARAFWQPKSWNWIWLNNSGNSAWMCLRRFNFYCSRRSSGNFRGLEHFKAEHSSPWLEISCKNERTLWILCTPNMIESETFTCALFGLENLLDPNSTA